jgi:hypothetical protein
MIVGIVFARSSICTTCCITRHRYRAPLIKDHLHGGELYNYTEPMKVHFGLLPPTTFFEIGAKGYMHQAQDPAQFQVVQSKKARRRAATKAKKERRELMLEARALLKETTRAEIKGDEEAAQRLRVKAANRRTGVASLRVPTPTSTPTPPTPTTRRIKVELIKGLEAASYILRRQMASARLSDSPHPLRNCRRKYRKVQWLQQQISSQIAECVWLRRRIGPSALGTSPTRCSHT